MNKAHTIVVPDLDIDATMLAQHGQKVSPNGKLERRIVAALIAHLGTHGWSLDSVFDGEIVTFINNTKDAMELIFNLDEASLRFRKLHADEPKVHGIFLVCGNGVDIISDYNYSQGDADGFNQTMEAFDAEEYA